jgi:hypothetical protein
VDHIVPDSFIGFNAEAGELRTVDIRVLVLEDLTNLVGWQVTRKQVLLVLFSELNCPAKAFVQLRIIPWLYVISNSGITVKILLQRFSFYRGVRA